ncbi:hypothetical protein [Bradyrhizobium sp. USDA 3650]
MSALQEFFQELSKLQPATLTAVTAVVGATGAVIVGVITGVITKFVVGARDRQDREVEWRKHAIELTKLDLAPQAQNSSADRHTATEAEHPGFLGQLS